MAASKKVFRSIKEALVTLLIEEAQHRGVLTNISAADLNSLSDEELAQVEQDLSNVLRVPSRFS